MLNKILNLVSAQKEILSYLNNPIRPLIYVDKLVKEDSVEIVDYLLQNKGFFFTDKKAFDGAGGYTNTYHLWLRNEEFGLICGFCFEGDYPDNYAFQKYLLQNL
jgi:hypothetical protein